MNATDFAIPMRRPTGMVSWLLAYPYTVCGVLLFLGLAGPFVLRRVSEWDAVYVAAAERLQAGTTIYDPRDGYAYPPFMALLAVPFTHLPPLGSRALFYLVNVACLVVMCRCAWRVAGGGALEGTASASRGEHLVCVLGLAVAFRYALDALAHQQTDLVIGALVLGGCYALGRARDWSAATCFGLAAAMKCTPLLWCLYLLWRRRWLPAVWLVGVAVGVNLLPDLINAPPRGGVWLGHWLGQFLLPMRGAEYLPGTWYSAIIYNQSLSGLGQRWLALDWAGLLEGTVRAGAPSARTIKLLIYGAELTLLAASAFVLGWKRPKERPTVTRAAEYSVVLLLMLLLSPMSSKPHFCTLLLPAFCLARLAVTERGRAQQLFLALSLLAGLLSTRGLVGVQFSSFMLWCGAVTWAAMFLLAGCFVELWTRRMPRDAVATPVAEPGHARAA